MNYSNILKTAAFLAGAIISVTAFADPISAATVDCPAFSDFSESPSASNQSSSVALRTDPNSGQACSTGGSTLTSSTHGARVAVRVGVGETLVYAFFHNGTTGVPDGQVSLTCTGGSAFMGTTHIVEIPAGPTMVDCTATYSNANRSDVLVFSAAGEVTTVPSANSFYRYIGATALTSTELRDLSVTLSGLSGAITGPTTVTAEFLTELATTGAGALTLADFSTTNLTLTDLSTGSPATPSDQPQTYTFNATPIGSGPVSITLPAATVLGYSGTANQVSNTLNGDFDDVPPVITAPSDITQATDTGQATSAASFDATVTDNLGETIELVFMIGSTVITSPHDFPIGGTTVTIDATDSYGNAATQVSFDVTINDTEAPIITVPADISVNAGAGNTSESVSFSATVTDNSGATIAPVFMIGSTVITSPHDFPIGETTVTIDAQDADGTDATQVSFTVTVSDITAPTVAISGLPAEFTGTPDLSATITFSEDVTDFESSDFNIANASVISLTGGPAVFSAIIRPSGGGDVTVSIPQNAAVDIGNNGNVASDEVLVASLNDTRTSEIINTFMKARLNSLIASQPSLVDIIRGSPHVDVDINGGTGSYSLATDPKKSIWARAVGNWTETDGQTSSYMHGTIGTHYQSGENLWLGAMIQYDDMVSYDGVARTHGQGWLVGPYFVTRLQNQPLYIEGSVLWGQSRNSISPFGTYTDEFLTDRTLATFQVTGEFETPSATLLPFLSFQYADDTQLAYMDSLGNTIGRQQVAQTELAFGLDVEIPISVEHGSLVFDGGLTGAFSQSYESGVASESSFNGANARVDMALTYAPIYGRKFVIEGFMAGIGNTGYQSYGVSAQVDIEF